MSDQNKPAHITLLGPDGKPLRSDDRDKRKHGPRRIGKRLKTSIIGLAAVLAAAVTIGTNAQAILKWVFPPQPLLESVLAVDYWRQTGAFQVPFFFSEGPNIARCPIGSQSTPTSPNCEYTSTIGKFWREQLADASVVKSNYLDFFDFNVGPQELWLSTTEMNAVDELYCLIQAMNGGIGISPNERRLVPESDWREYLGLDIRSDRLSRPLSEDLTCSETAGETVGFLTMQLTNSTEQTITDIDIEYIVFPNEGPFPSGREWGDRLLASMNELIPNSVWAWSSEVSDRQISQHLKQAPRAQRNLPDLRPGESIFLPVYVYRAKDDGFEAYFYRDWRLPNTLTYIVEGERITAVIPLPGRAESDVKPTFAGWHQQ